MDTTTFIEQCLNQVYERLTKSLEGLKAEELVWRPVPRANCIEEILWHMVRSEDRMIRSSIGLGPEVWERRHYYKIFGLSKEHSRSDDYKLLKESDLPLPKLEDLLSYRSEVHQDTLEKLHSLSPDDFGRVPNPEQPLRPMASYFRHLITHNNNHHGQIDFIRGLIQPSWDLPPGTGTIQP
jgi:uncharacterized damage-inducible protein DinB